MARAWSNRLMTTPSSCPPHPCVSHHIKLLLRVGKFSFCKPVKDGIYADEMKIQTQTVAAGAITVTACENILTWFYLAGHNSAY